jgi:hypothetical protein
MRYVKPKTARELFFEHDSGDRGGLWQKLISFRHTLRRHFSIRLNSS